MLKHATELTHLINSNGAATRVLLRAEVTQLPPWTARRMGDDRVRSLVLARVSPLVPTIHIRHTRIRPSRVDVERGNHAGAPFPRPSSSTNRLASTSSSSVARPDTSACNSCETSRVRSTSCRHSRCCVVRSSSSSRVSRSRLCSVSRITRRRSSTRARHASRDWNTSRCFGVVFAIGRTLPSTRRYYRVRDKRSNGGRDKRAQASATPARRIRTSITPCWRVLPRAAADGPLNERERCRRARSTAPMRNVSKFEVRSLCRTRGRERQLEIQPERLGSSLDRRERRVFVGILERCNLLLRHVNQLRKIALRHAAVLPSPTDTERRGERRRDVNFHRLHALRRTSMRPRPRRSLSLDEMNLKPTLERFARVGAQLVHRIGERLATRRIRKLGEPALALSVDVSGVEHDALPSPLSGTSTQPDARCFSACRSE